jgi:hypothetical protein
LSPKDISSTAEVGKEMKDWGSILGDDLGASHGEQDLVAGLDRVNEGHHLSVHDLLVFFLFWMKVERCLLVPVGSNSGRRFLAFQKHTYRSLLMDHVLDA